MARALTQLTAAVVAAAWLAVPADALAKETAQPAAPWDLGLGVMPQLNMGVAAPAPPATTPPPRFRGVGERLAKRHSTDNTCAYVSGVQSNSLYCDSEYECAVNSVAKVAGCCLDNGLSTCKIATACLASTESALFTTNNGLTTWCNDSEYPQCVTHMYVDEYYSGYSLFACGKTKGTDIVYYLPTSTSDSSSSSSSTSTSSSSTTSSSSSSTTTTTSSTTTPATAHTTTVGPTSTPTSTTKTSHKSNAGAIAGGVVGGVAAVAIAAVAAFFLKRRGDKNKAAAGGGVAGGAAGAAAGAPGAPGGPSGQPPMAQQQQAYQPPPPQQPYYGGAPMPPAGGDAAAAAAYYQQQQQQPPQQQQPYPPAAYQDNKPYDAQQQQQQQYDPQHGSVFSASTVAGTPTPTPGLASPSAELPAAAGSSSPDAAVIAPHDSITPLTTPPPAPGMGFHSGPVPATLAELPAERGHGELRELA